MYRWVLVVLGAEPYKISLSYNMTLSFVCTVNNFHAHRCPAEGGLIQIRFQPIS